MWDRNVLLWLQYGFWKAVVMASISSPLARTASPFHLCTAPPPHLGFTFGASEIRQKFLWPLFCCFTWSLQVLLALIQKKASRNSVPGLTWVFQEGIKQLEGSRWRRFSHSKPRASKKWPFSLLIKEWQTMALWVCQILYGKVNLGKNISSETCKTCSKRKMKTFVLMENVCPERWWIASTGSAGKVLCRSAAAAVMDLKENLQLERQLFQRYCLFCMFPASQALKGTILLTPSYTKAWKI